MDQIAKVEIYSDKKYHFDKINYKTFNTKLLS